VSIETTMNRLIILSFSALVFVVLTAGWVPRVSALPTDGPLSSKTDDSESSSGTSGHSVHHLEQTYAEAFEWTPPKTHDHKSSDLGITDGEDKSTPEEVEEPKTILEELELKEELVFTGVLNEVDQLEIEDELTDFEVTPEELSYSARKKRAAFFYGSDHDTSLHESWSTMQRFEGRGLRGRRETDNVLMTILNGEQASISTSDTSTTSDGTAPRDTLTGDTPTSDTSTSDTSTTVTSTNVTSTTPNSTTVESTTQNDTAVVARSSLYVPTDFLIPDDEYPYSPSEKEESGPVCHGINTKSEETKNCPYGTVCGYEMEDAKICRKTTEYCVLHPYCQEKSLKCVCPPFHICALEKVHCVRAPCPPVPVCLKLKLSGAMDPTPKPTPKPVVYTTPKPPVYQEPKSVVCSVKGSSKKIKCGKLDVCSAVLPAGKTCNLEKGEKYCPLEPRCLPRADAYKCNDFGCTANKATCILTEECSGSSPKAYGKNSCSIWPRCFDFGKPGEEYSDADNTRLNPYFKICRVEGVKQAALCLDGETCVKVVKPDDDCLKEEKCECTKIVPGCAVPGGLPGGLPGGPPGTTEAGPQSCEYMKCKRQCVYVETTGCNDFLLGPCCEYERKPFRLTCPPKPQCLPETIKTHASGSYPSKIVARPFDREKVCSLDYHTGPCNDLSIRWYFSKANNSCKPFIYGGCEGNENNFHTEKKCQQQCLYSSPSYGKNRY